MKKANNSLFDKLKQENSLEDYIQDNIEIFNSYQTKINILSNRINDLKQGFENKTIENLQSLKNNLIDSSFSIQYSEYYNVPNEIENISLVQHLEYEKEVIPMLEKVKENYDLLAKTKERQIEKPSFIIFLIYIPIQIFFEYLYSLTPGLGIFMSLGRFVGIGLLIYLIIQLIAYLRYNSIKNEIEYYTNELLILNEKIEKTKANIV